MTDTNRAAYISEIMAWENYSRTSNPMNLPNSYDCADVATYLYGQAMGDTNTGRTISNLTHAGSPINNISDIASTDFFESEVNNIDFYSDTSFNNEFVEVGSVMVWQGPGYNAETKTGWNGHVATVVSVTRDSNGNVSNIRIIQGHTGGNRTEVVDITSQADLNSYVGTFLGFGEIGLGSTQNINAPEK